MTPEQLPSDHAAIFGAAARRMTQAAVEFAQGVGPALTLEDAVRLYWLAGCHLALLGNSPGTVAGALRELADRLEAGAPVAN